MFKIKKEPKRPKKSEYKNVPKEVHRMGTYDLEMSISDCADKFAELAAKFPDGQVSLEIDYGGCFYEGDTPSTVIIISEEQYAEDLYNEALEKYEEKLLEYKQWYKINKKKIDAELERRKLYSEELEKLNEKFKS